MSMTHYWSILIAMESYIKSTVKNIHVDKDTFNGKEFRKVVTQYIRDSCGKVLAKDVDAHTGPSLIMAGEQSNIMIATSAFSTGNDYPHVHLVLHLDKLFEMLEYIQGKGRAGRDSAPVLCYTLVPAKQWKESRKEDPLEKNNKQALINHLHLYGSK
ncbi:hypothetical protein OG21DRAFT_1485434 [Imleria badia]|nr:hypothetical protein OG21DRAFT_1485434 [Imleria badia]